MSRESERATCYTIIPNLIFKPTRPAAAVVIQAFSLDFVEHFGQDSIGLNAEVILQEVIVKQK